MISSKSPPLSASTKSLISPGLVCPKVNPILEALPTDKLKIWLKLAHCGNTHASTVKLVLPFIE